MGEYQFARDTISVRLDDACDARIRGLGQGAVISG